VLDQWQKPRTLTVSGSQSSPHDTMRVGGPYTLRALEGLAVVMVDKGAGGARTTTWFTVTIEWVEYTKP
jgi:hypothetical protein